MTTHYLDANATEPLRPEAREAMLAAMDTGGNPSSIHQAGRHARRIVEDAREAIAHRFGTGPADVVFVSGGTEADALAVHGLGRGRRVIVGATEHDAIRAAAEDRVILPVRSDGTADLDALCTMLSDQSPALVCLMLANNETGVVHPIAEAAALCRRHGAWLHVDAVQAAGRMPVSLGALGAHSLALSSHKIGGPIGIGALLLAPEVTAIAPLIRGGGQERGRRGGTLPYPLIAGFAAAAGADYDAVRINTLRDAIDRTALHCGAIVCGRDAPRLPNTTCIALPGVRADAQVIALDLEGIAVSAGAACSSGKVGTSHVLTAMGLDAIAGEAIRISLPWNVADSAVDIVLTAYSRMAGRLRPALAKHAA